MLYPCILSLWKPLLSIAQFLNKISANTLTSSFILAVVENVEWSMAVAFRINDINYFQPSIKVAHHRCKGCFKQVIILFKTQKVSRTLLSLNKYTASSVKQIFFFLNMMFQSWQKSKERYWCLSWKQSFSLYQFYKPFCWFQPNWKYYLKNF